MSSSRKRKSADLDDSKQAYLIKTDQPSAKRARTVTFQEVIKAEKKTEEERILDFKLQVADLQLQFFTSEESLDATKVAVASLMKHFPLKHPRELFPSHEMLVTRLVRDASREGYCDKLEWLIESGILEPSLYLVELIIKESFSCSSDPFLQSIRLILKRLDLNSQAKERFYHHIKKQYGPRKARFLCMPEFVFKDLTLLEAAELNLFTVYRQISESKRFNDTNAFAEFTPENNPLMALLSGEKAWLVNAFGMRSEHDFIEYIVEKHRPLLAMSLENPAFLQKLYRYLLVGHHYTCPLKIINGIQKRLEGNKTSHMDFSDREAWIEIFVGFCLLFGKAIKKNETPKKLKCETKKTAQEIKEAAQELELVKTVFEDFLKIIVNDQNKKFLAHCCIMSVDRIAHSLIREDKVKALEKMMLAFVGRDIDLLPAVRNLLENNKIVFKRAWLTDCLMYIAKHQRFFGNAKDDIFNIIHLMFFYDIDFPKVIPSLFKIIKAPNKTDNPYFKENPMPVRQIPFKHLLPLNKESKENLGFEHSLILGFYVRNQGKKRSHFLRKGELRSEEANLKKVIELLLRFPGNNTEILHFNHDGMKYDGNIFDFMATQYVLNHAAFQRLWHKLCETLAFQLVMNDAIRPAQLRYARNLSKKDAIRVLYGHHDKKFHDDEQNTHRVRIHKSASEVATNLKKLYPPELKYQDEIEEFLRDRLRNEFRKYLSEQKPALSEDKIESLLNDVVARMHPVKLADGKLDYSGLTELEKDFKEYKGLFQLPSYVALVGFIKCITTSLFADPVSKVDLYTLIQSVWLAMKDKTMLSPDSDYKNLKNQFVETLHRNEIGNKGKPICESGQFNAIAYLLDGRHKLVKFHKIDRQNLHEFAAQFYDEIFQKLSLESKDHLAHRILFQNSSDVVALQNQLLKYKHDEVNRVLGEYDDIYAAKDTLLSDMKLLENKNLLVQEIKKYFPRLESAMQQELASKLYRVSQTTVGDLGFELPTDFILQYKKAFCELRQGDVEAGLITKEDLEVCFEFFPPVSYFSYLREWSRIYFDDYRVKSIYAESQFGLPSGMGVFADKSQSSNRMLLESIESESSDQKSSQSLSSTAQMMSLAGLDLTSMAREKPVTKNEEFMTTTAPTVEQSVFVDALLESMDAKGDDNTISFVPMNTTADDDLGVSLMNPSTNTTVNEADFQLPELSNGGQLATMDLTDGELDEEMLRLFKW